MQRIDGSWVRYLHGIDWVVGLRISFVLYLGWRAWKIVHQQKTQVVKTGPVDYTKCYGGA